MNKLKLYTLALLIPILLNPKDVYSQGDISDNRVKIENIFKTKDEKQDTVVNLNFECNLDDAYITRDGNVRLFHNPQNHIIPGNNVGSMLRGDGDLGYSIGSTVSSFSDLVEMKEKTRIPESLIETDFFTNYINAIDQSEFILVDKETGNMCYDSDFCNESKFSGVDFDGDKHFNIQRFFIDPHYKFFHVPVDIARMNAMNDIYKYYLFLENGDRDVAWQRANMFMETEVDPIVNSMYSKWSSENYSRIYYNDYNTLGEENPTCFSGDLNLYNSEDGTSLVNEVLNTNNLILSGKIEGELFSEEEIFEVLVNYNLVYRKKSQEEAEVIARESVSAPIVENYKQIGELESMLKNPELSVIDSNSIKDLIGKMKKTRFK